MWGVGVSVATTMCQREWLSRISRRKNQRKTNQQKLVFLEVWQSNHPVFPEVFGWPEWCLHRWFVCKREVLSPNARVVACVESG